MSSIYILNASYPVTKSMVHSESSTQVLAGGSKEEMVKLKKGLEPLPKNHPVSKICIEEIEQNPTLEEVKQKLSYSTCDR